MLMNDPFVLERANDLAERLRRERPGGAREQVGLLWRLLFATEPCEAEMQRSLIYVAEQTETLRAVAATNAAAKKDNKANPQVPASDPPLQALASLCQALLGANRFLYVD